MQDVMEMYVEKKLSIPEISKLTGVALSTIRFRLKKLGVLRSRGDALRLAAERGMLGGGLRGKTRVFTPEWKAKISESKKAAGELFAAGISAKVDGYVVYTRGPNKGRSVHVVAMEEHIGRRLFAFECVHHKDGDKQNNELSNLELMTKTEHARHHALERYPTRKRKDNGQFE